jgi:hypothetical protein
MKAVCVDNEGHECTLKLGELYDVEVITEKEYEDHYRVKVHGYDINYSAYRFKLLDDVGCQCCCEDDICEDDDIDFEYFPKNIYYREQQGVTVVEWLDDTKTIVKTHGDNFLPEFGVAMALVKKVYGTRSNFMRIVNSGKFQKEEIKKKLSAKKKIKKQEKIAKKIQNDLKELNALEKGE